MADLEKDKKIEFLYAAHNDAQELIRFIDTKTAVAISIIGVFILSIFSTLENVIKYFPHYDWLFWLFMLITLMLIIVCVIVSARIINPTNDPQENIIGHPKEKVSLLFFLARNSYNGYNKYLFPYLNSGKYKLDKKFQDFEVDLAVMNEDRIIETLSFELMKVSFIRNVKNDRFNILLWLTVITTAVFCLAFIIYFYETNHAKELLEMAHKCHRSSN